MIPKIGPNRGFTLLELLVAMSIMVVIASCLYTTLYTGFNARRVGLVAIEPDTTALNVLELMKQDLYGVVRPGKLAGGFVGTDSRFGQDDTDDLVFYTTSVPRPSTTTTVSWSNSATSVSNNSSTTSAAGGVAKIEFALVDNERQANYRLVRRVTRNLLSPKDIDPEEQVLCRSVKSLNFRFYDGNDWVDAWDSTTDANSLPLAVEVEIAIAYDDSHASGSASVLSYNDRVNVVAAQQTYKIRRLREAFAIPCGGAALTTTTTSTGSTGSTGGGGGGGGGGG